MEYPLIIAPEAEQDLEHAVNWYNGQRPGLGYEFLECVEVAFDRIRQMLSRTRSIMKMYV